MNILNSGQRPRRKSDDTTETSLAMWLDKALSRRARAHDNRPSGRQLTAIETAHLNNILAQPQVESDTESTSSDGATATDFNTAPEGVELPEPSTNKRLRPAAPTMKVGAAITFMSAPDKGRGQNRDDFERCHELRHWYMYQIS